MDPRIERAKTIIEHEAKAVLGVAGQLNGRFVAVVERILDLDGRVVTSGMGKAGIIAQKASATFASTGTPSIFLHPAEAIHGDLGRVASGDVLLAMSKSGETEEVLRLLAPVKAVDVPVIAITQSRNSSLGKHADEVLELGPIEEAGTYRLAPTASTTAMLSLCDALALIVQEGRRFGPEEFARYHPGGDLGRRLMRVEEVMRTGERNPTVPSGTMVLEAIRIMTQTPGRPGATSIVDGDGRLLGLFTDGDLRRLLDSGGDLPQFAEDLRGALRHTAIDEVMTRQPKTIAPDTYAFEAMAYLHRHRIDQMPVVDDGGRLLGILDVQDLLDLNFD